jgi:hypothetical protein
MEGIADSVVVKNWSRDEQLSWAEEYGERLWEEHGDNDVVSDFTDEEAEKDKKKAWDVVYSENENSILYDVKEITDDDSLQDEIIKSMRGGFMQAYEDARQ